MTAALLLTLVLAFIGRDASATGPNTWTNLTPATGPSARAGYAMAYDAESDRVILFGGSDASGLNGETWAYNVNTNAWTNMAPAVAPSPRAGAAVAYDPATDRVILFGGSTGFLVNTDETWAYDFNINTWTLRSFGPLSRVNAALADVAAVGVLLFGGWNGGFYSDTWIFRPLNNTWTNVTLGPAPSGRSGHGMVYDAQSNRVILFGGNSTGGFSQETWAYDATGNTWTRMGPFPNATTPSGRLRAATAYDGTVDRVILFGGQAGVSNDETWSYDFDANQWMRLVPSPAPSARDGAAMAFDSQSSRFILFGGVTASGYSGETWSYESPAAPSVPPFLQATPGNGQVVLTWQTPSSTGGLPIERYDVYRGTSPGNETLAAMVSVPTTFTDTGLTNGVTYYYQVSAVNAFGEGPRSFETFATPSSGAAVPTPPLNLRAFAGDNQTTLTWQPPASDGGSPVVGYRLYRGPSSGGESLLLNVSNVLAYTDTGLTNGVTYYYQVSALNAFGEGPRSNEAFATPQFPVATEITPTPGGNGLGVAFNVTPQGGTGPYTFQWDFGDGTTSTLQAPTHTYRASGTYTVTVTVTDAKGLTSTLTIVVEVKETPPFYATPGFAAAAFLAGLLLLSSTLAGLEYTRFMRWEEVLERKVRYLMFEQIQKHPGSSFSAIRDALGLQNGVTAYHLHVLQRQGLIHTETRRRHRWYYPNGDVSLWRELPLSPLQASLVEEVRNSPGIGVRELARAVDEGASSVAFNVKALAREGILLTEREGVKVRCFAKEERAGA